MKEIMRVSVGLRPSPGSLAAERGSMACRPRHDDWPQHNFFAISHFITANPYIRAELGDDADVSIQRSADGQTIGFLVSVREVRS